MCVLPVAKMGSKEAESSSSPPEEQESTGLASPSKEIPNGGLGAWLQVAGGFILQFNTWYVPRGQEPRHHNNTDVCITR